jgi:hypothetical protein
VVANIVNDRKGTLMATNQTKKTPSFNHLMPVFAMLVSRHASRLSSAAEPTACRELLAEAIVEVTRYCGPGAVDCFLSHVKAWLLSRSDCEAVNTVTYYLQNGSLPMIEEPVERAAKRATGLKNSTGRMRGGK